MRSCAGERGPTEAAAVPLETNVCCACGEPATGRCDCEGGREGGRGEGMIMVMIMMIFLLLLLLLLLLVVVVVMMMIMTVQCIPKCLTHR